MPNLNNFPTVKKTIPINNIRPNWWNPNVQNQEVYQKVKKTIEIHGAVDPIHVRPLKGMEGQYEVIDGEHRLKACKELGWTEMVCEVFENGLDDSTAKMLTLNLNNLRGQDDPLKRAKVYDGMEQSQLSLLAFDEKQIQAEKELLKFDFKQFESVEVSEEEKSPFSNVMETALKLERQLNAVKNYVKNEDAWALCLHLLDAISQLKRIFLVEKIVVEQPKVVENQTSIMDAIKAKESNPQVEENK